MSEPQPPSGEEELIRALLQSTRIQQEAAERSRRSSQATRRFILIGLLLFLVLYAVLFYLGIRKGTITW